MTDDWEGFVYYSISSSEILGLVIERLQICAVFHKAWWKLITFKACLITLAIVVVLCLVAKLCLTLQPHGLQHARLPHPSLSPRVCSDSCPLSQWCHLTILSSVIPSPPAFSLSQHQGLLQWFGSWWPNYRSFSFSNSASIEHSGLIFFRIDWFDLHVVQGTLESLL